jgi:hypothetical protein
MIGLLSTLFGTSTAPQPPNNNPLRLGGVVAGVALAVTAGLFTWRSPSVIFKSTFSNLIKKKYQSTRWRSCQCDQKRQYPSGGEINQTGHSEPFRGKGF